MIKIELFDYSKGKILMNQPKYGISGLDKGSTTIIFYLSANPDT